MGPLVGWVRLAADDDHFAIEAALPQPHGSPMGDDDALIAHSSFTGGDRRKFAEFRRAPLVPPQLDQRIDEEPTEQHGGKDIGQNEVAHRDPGEAASFSCAATARSSSASLR